MEGDDSTLQPILEATGADNKEDSRETDTPASDPTEDEIEERLKEHQKDIQSCLRHSELYDLYEQLDLDWDANESGKQKEASEKLIKKVIKQKAYSTFLRVLIRTCKNTTVHMGHKYIVSLLRGEEFGSQELRQESKMLLERIRETDKFEEFLDVDALRPSLLQHGLLTNEEVEDLHSPSTSSKKARKLRTILKTKGPTAHHIFVHESLAAERSHRSHSELYFKLTSKVGLETSDTDKNRKRKATSDTRPPATKVTKRYPCFLEGPEGLKTEEYLSEVRKMRKYHLTGKTHWQKAEEVYVRVMSSWEYPMEMKIAITLESATMYITNRQAEVVEERVLTARCLCAQLYETDMSNVDILAARCDWVLAKLYRYTKRDTAEATEKINSAIRHSYQYGEGEERALISYCHACILLGKENKSRKDEVSAINDLNIAIGCASRGDYGLDISHCKLRLAQAHVGSSTGNTGKGRGEVAQDDIDEARRVLNEIREEELSPRTRCMFLYTWSDVLRVDGQLEQAAEYAEKSLKIAREHDFKTEIKSAELRQKRLQEEHIHPHTQSSH